VAGYVVMPEHVHLLVGEPRKSTVSELIHALKLSVAMRRTERPSGRRGFTIFWCTARRSKSRSSATYTATRWRGV
jgi:putative transposase